MKRLQRAIALVAALIFVVGCRVDATVDVRIARDGAGVVAVAVALDDEALGRLGDPASRLRLDDLRTGGWRVDPPVKEKDAKTYFRAAKDFIGPEQFAAVMSEVTGPAGVLQSFGFRQRTSFAKTATEVFGRIDFSGGLAVFSDVEVSAALGGNPLGRPDADIAKENANTSLTLRITVPGPVDGAADQVRGSTAQWTATPAQPPRDVVIRSTEVRNGPRLFTALGVGLAVLSLMTLAGRLVRRDQRSRRAPLAAPPPIPATPAGPVRAKPKVRAVVVDAMGVLYSEGDDVGAHLLPFVRERGGTTNEGLIRERYREASLGRLSSGELWQQLGVEGDAHNLDVAYTDRFALNDGVFEFLEAMERRGVVVACLSNDVIEWSELLRYRFDLEDRIGPWVISGAVGVRKPDRAIFRALRRELQLPFEACLMVDDRPTNLNAARHLGMSTALYTPMRLVGVDHRQVRNLVDLLGRTRGGRDQAESAETTSGPGPGPRREG